MANSAVTLDVPRPRFFYGWVIVVLALLCSFWGLGMVQRSYTVILRPLTDDLGVPPELDPHHPSHHPVS